MVLYFSSVCPHSSISTNGLAMLRPGFGRCLAPITCKGRTQLLLFSAHNQAQSAFLYISGPWTWLIIMTEAQSVCACGGTPWPQFCIWLPSCPDEGRSYPYAWTPAAARSPFVRSDWRGRCSAACIYLGGHKNLNNFTVSLLLQANPDNFLTGRLDSVTCVIFSAGVDRYPPKTWQTT